MKITILSKDKVVHYQPSEKSFLIRIGDTPSEFEDISANYEDVLTLCFYDIYPKPAIPLNWNAFSKKEAISVIEFFNKIETQKNASELVIHCHAGISRSPAIALSYAWFVGSEALQNDIMLGKHIPNGHVLNVMANALNVSSLHYVKTVLNKYLRKDCV